MDAAEAVYAKYRDDINFLIVYTVEAYPYGSACPYTGEETEVFSSKDTLGFALTQPKNYKERVFQAKEFLRQLGYTMPMVVDDIDNAIWCTYGPASNIAYLIDTDGKVLVKQAYYSPEEMDAEIAGYLQGR
ncbi:hypothetical protein ACFLTL_01625 [Chloroflexota bacterium]